MAKLLCEKQDGNTTTLNIDEPTLRVSSYGVLLSGKSVLVTKTYMPLWEFPGGSVEKGETLFQALRREFIEEAGIDVIVKNFIAERESFYLSPTGEVFHSFQHFFLVTEKRGGISRKLSVINPPIYWALLTDLSSKNMKKSAWDILTHLKMKEKGGIFLPTRC